MKFALYFAGNFIAAVPEPVESKRSIGTKIGAYICICRNKVDHAAVWCLIVCGLCQNLFC